MTDQEIKDLATEIAEYHHSCGSARAYMDAIRFLTSSYFIVDKSKAKAQYEELKDRIRSPYRCHVNIDSIFEYLFGKEFFNPDPQ